jgi:hypothetical protein
MVPFCGRLGRAAARPYRIGPGRDDLPVVRLSPERLHEPAMLIFSKIRDCFSAGLA